MRKRDVVRLLIGCAVGLGVFVAGSGVGLAAGKSGSVTVYAGPPLQKPPAGISSHADALPEVATWLARHVAITVRAL